MPPETTPPKAAESPSPSGGGGALKDAEPAYEAAQDYLRAAMMDAVRVLVEVMHDPLSRPSDRRQAAADILNRTGVTACSGGDEDAGPTTSELLRRLGDRTRAVLEAPPPPSHLPPPAQVSDEELERELSGIRVSAPGRE
jgi:predicted amidohydrolase YtcJ